SARRATASTTARVIRRGGAMASMRCEFVAAWWSISSPSVAPPTGCRRTPANWNTRRLQAHRGAFPAWLPGTPDPSPSRYAATTADEIDEIDEFFLGDEEGGGTRRCRADEETSQKEVRSG